MGARWTDDERLRLRDLDARGFSLAAMAATLGRTPGAVRNERKTLGAHPPRPAWPDEDKARLRVLEAEGASMPAIAASLGRSLGSVIGMRYVLALRRKRAWTPSERETLHRLRAARVPSRAIADALDRPSAEAIDQEIQRQRRRRRRHAERGARGQLARLIVETLRALTADEWSAPELAEHLGVTVRTAWRIIATLRAMLPLERTRDGHATYYRLPRRWWEE